MIFHVSRMIYLKYQGLFQGFTGRNILRLIRINH